MTLSSDSSNGLKANEYHFRVPKDGPIFDKRKKIFWQCEITEIRVVLSGTQFLRFLMTDINTNGEA